MRTKLWRRRLALAVVALGLSTGSVLAEYPEKPVNLVVSYSPGGATDFQARLVTMLAQDYLGQPMVILNKPGAGGQVGWNYLVTQAGAEGYDLAAYNVPHFIAQSIVFKNVKYNVDNLEPIANWGADPAVLIVNKDSEFNSVQDLLDFAKANPGKLTVSGAGLYVGHHIATLQLQQAAGVKLRYVPTKGGVDAMKFVLGGQVKSGFNNLSDAYRSRDQIKILAIADLERDKDFLPDVPTFKEQGIDIDDSSVNFRGVMAPKGVSEDVLAKLAEKFAEMFQAGRVTKKMKDGGSPMRVMSRAEVKQLWQDRQAYLEVLLKDLKK